MAFRMHSVSLKPAKNHLKGFTKKSGDLPTSKIPTIALAGKPLNNTAFSGCRII
jgi:hypothetical protein